MKRIIGVLLFIILLSSTAYAQKNSIKLLAVTDNNKQGLVVDLDLEIVPGSGRVFVETQPLSNIDTQISLRVAKTIACKTTTVYCQDKDFIYSIHASSPVIAGPSAGAAIALLTRASLENKKLDEHTVITGTINSGGVIGVVGGVKEKIEAAARNGVDTVLIPKGETNISTPQEYKELLNLTIIEVSDIEEAYAVFTGIPAVSHNITLDKTYSSIMNDLNKEICERTIILDARVAELKSTSTKDAQEAAKNFSSQAKDLHEQGKFYSSASRCFGANVNLQDALLKENNESFSQVLSDVKGMIDQLENESNTQTISTLGDLEASMIVRERILDARKNLDEAEKENSTRDLAYAIERTYSAIAWKSFIGFQSKAIDQTKLSESCVAKIAEAHEVYNYVSIYLPGILEDSKESIDLAKKDLESRDYASCLFRASKAQAEIDTAFSSLYVSDASVESLLESKIEAARKAIARQTAQGIFPIIGYSYYEYAQVLSDTEKYSALLYAEYGVELSNLNIYFPQKKPFGITFNERAFATLIFGLIIGAAIVLIRRQYRRNKITLRRKR